VILVAWLHFLAFDLFVGRWTWQRMVATNQPLYISTPVLILSMMVAPLGALIGLVITRELGDGKEATPAVAWAQGKVVQLYGYEGNPCTCQSKCWHLLRKVKHMNQLITRVRWKYKMFSELSYSSES